MAALVCKTSPNGVVGSNPTASTLYKRYDMKVKIGDNIYDSNNTAIMLILSQEEKQLISDMARDATKFLSYPENMTEQEATDFMKLR